MQKGTVNRDRIPRTSVLVAAGELNLKFLAPVARPRFTSEGSLGKEFVDRRLTIFRAGLQYR